jgi:ribosomal protein L27
VCEEATGEMVGAGGMVEGQRGSQLEKGEQVRGLGKEEPLLLGQNL